MAKRTEHSRWTSIMKKLDNKVKKSEDQRKSKRKEKK